MESRDEPGFAAGLSLPSWRGACRELRLLSSAQHCRMTPAQKRSGSSAPARRQSPRLSRAPSRLAHSTHYLVPPIERQAAGRLSAALSVLCGRALVHAYGLDDVKAIKAIALEVHNLAHRLLLPWPRFVADVEAHTSRRVGNCYRLATTICIFLVCCCDATKAVPFHDRHAGYSFLPIAKRTGAASTVGSSSSPLIPMRSFLPLRRTS